MARRVGAAARPGSTLPGLALAGGILLAGAMLFAGGEFEEDIPISLDLLPAKTQALLKDRFPSATVLDAFEGEREETNLQIVRILEGGRLKLVEQWSDESLFAVEEEAVPSEISRKASAALARLSDKDSSTTLRRMERLVYKLRVRKGESLKEYLVTPAGAVYQAVEPGERDADEERRHDALLRPPPPATKHP